MTMGTLSSKKSLRASIQIHITDTSKRFVDNHETWFAPISQEAGHQRVSCLLGFKHLLEVPYPSMAPTRLE